MTTTRLLVMCGLATTLAIGAYTSITAAPRATASEVVEADPFEGFDLTTEGLLTRADTGVVPSERWREAIVEAMRSELRAEQGGEFRPAIILPTDPAQFGGWMDDSARAPEWTTNSTSVPPAWSEVQYVTQPTDATTDDIVVMLRVRDIGDFRFEGGDVKSMAPVRTYRGEGGETIKTSGRATHSVTLRRSIADNGMGVEGWFRDTTTKSPGRDAVIAFYDGEGNELRVYELTGVYPLSLSLNDRGGLGAWGEEIVLSADGIRRAR